MRIKYRLWDQITAGKGKYYYDPEQVYECMKQQALFNLGSKFGFDHIGLGSAFELWTGLKDRSGQDIYEGDIVKEYDGSTYTILHGQFETRDAYCIGFHFKEDVWPFGTPRTDSVTVEIVGNIHEPIPQLTK